MHTLIDWHRQGADVSALLPVLSTYLGHVEPKNTYWYLSAVPELMQLAAARLEARDRRVMTALAPVLQAFFTERLIAQRRASRHTITGYRDTFRLLLGFAAPSTGKTPSALDIADLDAPLIAAFLDHLEHERHNTVRTRNWRLAAIHSLFGYAALHHPEHAAVIQRVLAIPAKRYERTLLTWLTAPEVDALLAAPDRGTWTGRRDHAMLVLAVQTGLRISELIGLSRADVDLGAGAHVHCMGKGRKERATPLTGLTVAVLRGWLTENPGRPTTRCSRPAPGPGSATTPSSTASPTTSRPRAPAARRCAASTSPCTPCATPAPCGCCTPASTSPSSRSGSATSRSPPPRSTCTPTWSRRSEPSPGSPRPAPHPAATSHPTRYSPSSTGSDCSDLPPSIALPRTPIRAQVGTITRSDQSALFRHRDNADSARYAVATDQPSDARRISSSGLCSGRRAPSRQTTRPGR